MQYSYGVVLLELFFPCHTPPAALQPLLTEISMLASDCTQGEWRRRPDSADVLLRLQLLWKRAEQLLRQGV